MRLLVAALSVLGRAAASPHPRRRARPGGRTRRTWPTPTAGSPARAASCRTRRTSRRSSPPPRSSTSASCSPRSPRRPGSSLTAGNLVPGWNVGNPLRAGWNGTRGVSTKVAFTNRYGALLRGTVYRPLRRRARPLHRASALTRPLPRRRAHRGVDPGLRGHVRVARPGPRRARVRRAHLRRAGPGHQRDAAARGVAAAPGHAALLQPARLRRRRRRSSSATSRPAPWTPSTSSPRRRVTTTPTSRSRARAPTSPYNPFWRSFDRSRDRDADGSRSPDQDRDHRPLAGRHRGLPGAGAPTAGSPPSSPSTSSASAGTDPEGARARGAVGVLLRAHSPAADRPPEPAPRARRPAFDAVARRPASTRCSSCPAPRRTWSTPTSRWCCRPAATGRTSPAPTSSAGSTATSRTARPTPLLATSFRYLEPVGNKHLGAGRPSERGDLLSSSYCSAYSLRDRPRRTPRTGTSRDVGC